MPDITSAAEFGSFQTFLACCGVDSEILNRLDRDEALELYYVTMNDIAAHITHSTAHMEREVNENFRKLPPLPIAAKVTEDDTIDLIVSNSWLVDMLLVDHRYEGFLNILKFTGGSPHWLLSKFFSMLIYQPWNSKSRKKYSQSQMGALLCCEGTDLTLPHLTVKSTEILSTWFNRITSTTCAEIDLFFAGILARNPVLNKWDLWKIVNGRGPEKVGFYETVPYLAGIFINLLSLGHCDCVETLKPNKHSLRDLQAEWTTMLRDANQAPAAHAMNWFRDIITRGKTLSVKSPALIATSADLPSPKPTHLPRVEGSYRVRLTIDLYADQPIPEGEVVLTGDNITKLGRLLRIPGLKAAEVSPITARDVFAGELRIHPPPATETSAAKRVRVAEIELE
jgi:hypothetical protein